MHYFVSFYHKRLNGLALDDWYTVIQKMPDWAKRKQVFIDKADSEMTAERDQLVKDIMTLNDQITLEDLEFFDVDDLKIYYEYLLDKGVGDLFFDGKR